MSIIEDTVKHQKVFPFTNENVSSYGKLYNFENAKVLSVLGSGDQYFTSILHGAKEVELYDINVNAWDHFVLKYYAILILPYEEFFDLFVLSKLRNMKILNKILPHLPYETRKNLELFIKTNGSLHFYTFTSIVYIKFPDLMKRNLIPYLNKYEYYKLQNMLRTRKLPAYYLYNLTDLPQLLSQNTYDIVLTSNIYQWLNMSLEDYRQLLEKINSPIIQSDYYWKLPLSMELNFRKNGFEVSSVGSILNPMKKDKIITFKK